MLILKDYYVQIIVGLSLLLRLTFCNFDNQTSVCRCKSIKTITFIKNIKKKQQGNKSFRNIIFKYFEQQLNTCRLQIQQLNNLDKLIMWSFKATKYSRNVFIIFTTGIITILGNNYLKVIF